MMIQLVCSVCLGLGVLAQSQDFDVFFKEFAAKRDGIRVLEADFTQRTILPDELLITEGKLFYGQPRRVIFKTEEPLRTTLIDGSTGYEYEPEIKQLVIFELEQNPQADVFFLAFENDPAKLREAYDVSLFTVSDEAQGSRGILLRPKAGTETYFKEVGLFLRDKDYLPFRIRILNEDDGQLLIDIPDYTVNGNPKPEDTQISAAPGTAIIENDELVETVGEEGRKLPEPLPLVSGGSE